MKKLSLKNLPPAKSFFRGVGLLIFLLVEACNTTTPETNQESAIQVERRKYQIVFATEGTASYYAQKFNGRPTASGEIYDSDLLTAAHRDFPFGTLVRVTNLNNQQKVIVKINDRGPFSGNRIIDLSVAAARKLDFIHQGVTKVRIERLQPIGFSTK